MIDLFSFQPSSNELIADLQPLRSATKYDYDYTDVLAAILLKHFSHVVEVESYLESYRNQYRENLLKIISVHTNSDNFASLSHLQLPEDFKKRLPKD